MAIVFASALLFSGCATVAPAPPADSATAKAVHSYRPEIELSGRLSVRYQQDNKEEALHGSFNWIQTADQTRLALLSPLGQTIAEINTTPAASTLTQSGKPPKTAPDPDALAAEALGWPLPLKGLRDWLQGFATKGDGSRFIANTQSNHVTTADGWRINYVTWQDDTAQPDLIFPKRIDLERNTVQAGEVSIRIVVDTMSAH